jgi:DUF4097 and DUF4098 domain-containing protein YvlB
LKTAIAILAAVSAVAVAQPQTPEFRVAFSDSSRPRLLKVELMNGRINVRGYDGKEAIITGTGGSGNTGNLPMLRAFSVVEHDNIITVGGGAFRNGTVNIQIPFETSLQLRCTNCPEIRADNIKGDVDASTVNGAIRLYGISGSVLANTTNDNIVVVFDQIDPVKPNSFSSLNGNIDCTFPKDLKATVRMRTENGKIHTDFDIRLAAGAITRTDRGLAGTIGGGKGPDIQFKGFNGSIYIRRKP